MSNPSSQNASILAPSVWNFFWKVKLPLKVLMFLWKFLHNCLPTFDNLRKRGIQVAGRCLMCDEMEESAVHLFLNCTCARAIWHGSNLGLRTSELEYTSAEQWLSQCIISSKDLEQSRMIYLQTIFTTLWSIWNHRNMVLHHGLIPNPIDVFLVSQSLICRYQKAFNHHQMQENRPRCKRPMQITSLIRVLVWRIC